MNDYNPKMILVLFIASIILASNIIRVESEEDPLREPLMKSYTDSHPNAQRLNNQEEHGAETKNGNSESLSRERRAIRCLELGDLETALTAFKEIVNSGIKMDILDAAVFQKLGNRLYYDEKQDEDALWCYAQAYKMESPDEAYLLHKIGICNHHLRNFEAAIPNLKAAVIMDPKNEHWQVDLGLAIFDSGIFDESTKETLRLLDQFRLRSLGNRWRYTGKIDAAIYCYGEAISKDSKDGDLYSLRGECYVTEKNWNAAISDFRLAVEKSPTVRNWFILINTMFRAGKKSDAIAKETFALDEAGFIKLTRGFLSNAEFEYALIICDAGIKQYPSAATLFTLRGQCLLNIHNSTVKDEFTNVFELDLKNRMKAKSDHTEDQLRNLYVKVAKLFSDGKFDEGIAETHVLKSPAELGMLIDYFLFVEKFEHAFCLCNDATLRYEGKSLFFRQRGYCLDKMGNTDLAIVDLRKANELDQSNTLGKGLEDETATST